MTIRQDELRQAAQRAPLNKRVTAAVGQLTGFLCHSHKDRNLAEGLQQKLRESGLDLYIDWQDSAMPERTNRETAARIQQKIISSDVFIFLATENSLSSRWCPWELGYADGRKKIERIAVLATRDSSGQEYGNEYIQLYRRIDASTTAGALQWYPVGSPAGRILGSFTA